MHQRAKVDQSKDATLANHSSECLIKSWSWSFEKLSNAIIRYLARGTALVPDDGFAQAKIDQWLFWEQYSHEPYVATCRFHMVYRKLPRETRDADKVRRGEAALDLMDQQLVGKHWLANGAFSIADIALLAYTRVAAEGGFDLTGHGNLRKWIGRCEAELKLA